MLSQVIIGRASGLGRDWIQAFPSTFLFLLLNIWVWSINHDWRHLLDILVGASNVDPHTQALALFAGATLIGLAIAGAKGMAGILTDLLEGRYWPRVVHLGAVAKRREQAAREAASHRKQWEDFCDRYQDSSATNMNRLREEDRLLQLLGRRRYPLDPERIAPTAIGNVQAAAEEHIQRRHGFTPSRVWSHFWLLIPQDARAELDKARTTTQRTALYLVWCLAFPLSASAVYSTLPWLMLLKIVAGVFATWIIVMYVVSRVSDIVATAAMFGYTLILAGVCVIAIYQQQLSFIVVLLAGPVITALMVRFVMMSRVIRYHELLVAAFDVHATLIHDALARETASTWAAETTVMQDHIEGRGAATSPMWAWGMAAEYAYDAPWPDSATNPAAALVGLPHGASCTAVLVTPKHLDNAGGSPVGPSGPEQATCGRDLTAHSARSASASPRPAPDREASLATHQPVNAADKPAGATVQQAAGDPHRTAANTPSGQPAAGQAAAGQAQETSDQAVAIQHQPGASSEDPTRQTADGGLAEEIFADPNPQTSPPVEVDVRDGATGVAADPTNDDLPVGLVRTNDLWRVDGAAQSVAQWQQAASRTGPHQ